MEPKGGGLPAGVVRCWRSCTMEKDASYRRTPAGYVPASRVCRKEHSGPSPEWCRMRGDASSSQGFVGGSNVMHLDAYRDQVQSIAADRSGGAIYNGSLNSAAIVVEALFSSAREDVTILTGKLNPRVYGRDDVVLQAKLFLVSDAKNRMRIILEENKLENRKLHPLLQSLSSYRGFSIRYAPPSLQASYDFHFVAADSDCYQFKRDKTKLSAIAAFGDIKRGPILTDFFEKAWNQCLPLSIQ